MCELYFESNDIKKALVYNKKALVISRYQQDSSSIVECMLNEAKCNIALGYIDGAIVAVGSVNNYAIKHDIQYLQLKATEALANSYYQQGNYKLGYNYYKQYATINEDINRKAYSSSLSSLQGDYSLQKSETNVRQLQQANQIQELTNKKNTYFIVALLLVALIVMSVSLLLFRQNKQKQKVNAQLQVQNGIIAQKNREIESSIKYAKGIQQALLTSKEYIDKHFSPDYFIYYEAKDIVSGDFYWAVQQHNKFYIAIADCTGHGVPGAFMSLLNISLLNENVIEQGMAAPAEILNEQRREIIEALNPNGNENVKDGMDCVLCAFDLANMLLTFAASNNPLWLIRNNELIEYKADKMPVGKYHDVTKDFSTQTISLQKNDCIYMFTDGYADQFGGPKGKKFMYKQLKNFLLTIAHLPMKEQQQQLSTTFTNWKGALEQVDDVCVMGIRV